MNELELIKAFAEVERVELFDELSSDAETGEAVEWVSYHAKSNLLRDAYNPITDLALNCAARDKYRAEVGYYGKHVSIYHGRLLAGLAYIKDGNVGRAVIECIVKSRDKWSE